MKFKAFEKFKKIVNEYDPKSEKDILKEIDVDEKNFQKWIEVLLGKNNQVSELDMEKLPYIIDEMYQSNEQIIFVLGCMILEATFEQIEFLTNLENYPMFKEKYLTFKHTLLTIYDGCDNGIFFCMAQILLKNDPTLELFTDEEKEFFISSTKQKLRGIIEYFNANPDTINPIIYDNIEILADICCEIEDEEIKEMIQEIAKQPLSNIAAVFVIKYQLQKNLPVSEKMVKDILTDKEYVKELVNACESIDKFKELPLYEEISQEQIAYSNMVGWLKYPTELGKIPEEISLLESFEIDDEICYSYKFRASEFWNQEEMIGISGGYPKNEITARDCGWTFSKFETLEKDYQKQGRELVKFIQDYWKKVAEK